MNPISYVLDPEGTILSVEGGWNDFAIANNSSCLSNSIIDKSIYSFFSVDQVKSLYKKVFSSVLFKKRPLEIKFRCDSDKVLRFMSMTIEPKGERDLRVTTYLVREVDRKQILGREILYMALMDNYQKMCSHCNKIYIATKDRWMEIDDALFLGLIKKDLDVRFDLCEACNTGMNSLIHDYERS